MEKWMGWNGVVSIGWKGTERINQGIDVREGAIN